MEKTDQALWEQIQCKADLCSESNKKPGRYTTFFAFFLGALYWWTTLLWPYVENTYHAFINLTREFRLDWTLTWPVVFVMVIFIFYNLITLAIWCFLIMGSYFICAFVACCIFPYSKDKFHQQVADLDEAKGNALVAAIKPQFGGNRMNVNKCYDTVDFRHAVRSYLSPPPPLAAAAAAAAVGE